MRWCNIQHWAAFLVLSWCVSDRSRDRCRKRALWKQSQTHAIGASHPLFQSYQERKAIGQAKHSNQPPWICFCIPFQSDRGSITIRTASFLSFSKPEIFPRGINSFKTQEVILYTSISQRMTFFLCTSLLSVFFNQNVSIHVMVVEQPRFLVLLGSVMMVLSSEETSSRVTSSIARMALLRRAFSQEQTAVWWSKAVGNASRWGRKDSDWELLIWTAFNMLLISLNCALPKSLEGPRLVVHPTSLKGLCDLRNGLGELPAGWTWSFEGSFVLLDVDATPQRLFGVLQSLEEVIPQMAAKLRNSRWPRRLMELVASILERAGRISQSMERSDQMHITRQCLRAAILRCKDLIEQFPERLPEMLEALKPAESTLEFLFQRLATTSGAVQTSAVVLLARSWSCEPALFPCFEAFPVLPWLFRVPAAKAVRAMIADSGRAGNVVPIVAEVALRLCRGSSLETTRKARRLFRDVKRDLRKRHREGEESGDSDEEEMVDKEAQDRDWLNRWPQKFDTFHFD